MIRISWTARQTYNLSILEDLGTHNRLSTIFQQRILTRCAANRKLKPGEIHGHWQSKRQEKQRKIIDGLE